MDNNNQNQVNMEVMLRLLRTMDFDNLMDARFLSRNVNELIMRHRSTLARNEISHIHLMNMNDRWSFTIRKSGGHFEINDERKARPLAHLKPKILHFSCESPEETIDSVYSIALNYFPAYWYKDIRTIQLDQPGKVAIGEEVLRKFQNLEVIWMNYKSPFTKLSDVVGLMHAVRILKISLSNDEPEYTTISSTDADLLEITRKSENLEQLRIKGSNCENKWKTSTFLEFLRNANFAERVQISFEKWLNDPERFINWLEENTMVATRTLIRTDYSGNYLNYYHNSFQFHYRGSKFYLDIKEVMRNGNNYAD